MGLYKLTKVCSKLSIYTSHRAWKLNCIFMQSRKHISVSLGDSAFLWQIKSKTNRIDAMDVQDKCLSATIMRLDV